MDFDPNLLNESALANLRDNNQAKEAILDAIARRNSTEEDELSDWEIYRDAIRAAYHSVMPIDEATKPLFDKKDFYDPNGHKTMIPLD